jgi:hypothetical protein
VSNQTKWLFALAVLITVVVVVPLTLLNLHVHLQAAGPRHSAWPRPLQVGTCRSRIPPKGAMRWQTCCAPWTTCSEGLGTLVAQVRDASGNIATASQEIATGNQDLSHRTEQTASNAQAAVSSLSQITANGAANGIVFANGQPAGSIGLQHGHARWFGGGAGGVQHA